MKRNTSLRRRILLSIVALLAGGFGFALAGTYLFLAVAENRFYDDLSEEAQAALELDWLEVGAPGASVLEEIALAHERYIYPAYESSYAVFAILSVLVVLIGSGLAWQISRRLTQPLECASKSAQIIASGDFTHQFEVPEGASDEIASLGESFGFLSASLQDMEENVRYTSASVAHELRTPLTVIQGYVQGIQDGVFQADTEQLDLILGHVDGLSRLVDDLKLISLAEAKDLVLHRTEANLNAAVLQAVNFMRPQFEEAGRTLEFQKLEGAVSVFFDVERVKQALLALLSNALRYGGQGVSCKVTCTDGNDSISLTVSDTGVGFSEAALDRGSERFWRGDASRDRASGGSGLGLAVVRAIAEAHGGSLNLSNSPKGGAVASIKIPKPE